VRRWLRLAAAAVAVAVTVGVAVGVAACGDHGDAPIAPVPLPAPAVHAARDAGVTDAAPARFVGVVAAAESVDIAPRTTGVILKVSVAAGDAVTAGQVVAEMDPIQLQEELRTAEAALGAAVAAHQQAAVDVEDARRKLAVETAAVAKGLSPGMALDDAKFALKRAEAAIERAASTQAAEASRAQTARDHVTDTELRAPFAGTVAARLRDAGNRVEAGTPIVRIVGSGGMRLRFAVPPALDRLAVVGGRVTATVDTAPAPIAATIKQVTPSVDAASGMIIVEATLPSDASTSALRPGLAAWVQPAAPAP
jgi:RND family efflux transporter MFP subunit